MENFSDYEINPSEGTVFSKKSNRFVGHKLKGGYIQVSLMGDNGKVYNYLIHRLIWESVNGTIPNGMEIDHIDTNPSNNRISNLICVTHKENSNNPLTLKHYSEAKLGEKHSMFGKQHSEESKKKMSQAKMKPCAKLDKNTLEILEVLPCTLEFQRQYGYSQGNISQCCNGKLKTAYGFRWKYI